MRIVNRNHVSNRNENLVNAIFTLLLKILNRDDTKERIKSIAMLRKDKENCRSNMSFFCKGGTFLAKKIVVYVYVGYSKGRNFCEIRIENLTMQHI